MLISSLQSNYQHKAPLWSHTMLLHIKLHSKQKRQTQYSINIKYKCTYTWPQKQAELQNYIQYFQPNIEEDSFVCLTLFYE